MNYQEFKEKLIRALKEQVEEEATITVHTVQKNNGVNLDAITIMGKDENLAPTFYIADWFEDYEAGKSINQIVNRLIFQWNEHRLYKSVNIDLFTKYENVKQRVVFKVINFKENEALLESVPHKTMLDLAMVYYYEIPQELCSNATVMIRNKDLEMWEVTADEVMEDAKNNTPKLLPYSYQTMASMLQEIFEESSMNIGDEEELQHTIQQEGIIPMYVLSNEKKHFGAGSIFYPNVLEQVSNQFKSNLYILPSSIHECIIIPESREYSKEELETMVEEINVTQVPAQEVLSNRVYTYLREEKELVL